MKKVNWLMHIYAICCLFLTACQDDNDRQIIPPGTGDLYEGSQYVITLQNETEDFHYPDFICTMSTEDGTIISRKGEHVRLEGKSVLTLETGLKHGIYRMLYLTTPIVAETSTDTIWYEYGLGCRVEISETDTAKILDTYSRAMRLCGSGTKEDPFIVSSSDHLKRIRDVANDQAKNNLLLANTHFLQTADIDMDRASWDSDHEFGWLSIGSLPNNPFRGVYDGGGYVIRNLWSSRNRSSGIGLFGFTEKTILKHVRLENPRMEGNFAVGALVGATTSAGNSRDQTSLIACHTQGGYIRTTEGSVGAGGLIGVVDMYGICLIDSCTNANTPVSGAYGIGGLLGMGSLYSQVYIQQCANQGNVTADYTGSGGIVGSADSLSVIGCTNTAAVVGGKSYSLSDASNGGYGTGGIAGGTGVSYIYACINKGDINGCIGVGGIIGSTRIGSDETLFNNTLAKSCGNTGAITGETAVGGICGEAQFGCYAVYNTGTITATTGDSHIGGIVGNTSISVIHNALNTGKISAPDTHCAGGVMGKTTWGVIFASQNLGDINVNADYAGGIVGLAGNYTMVNYCYNAGYLQNSGNGSTGGIIGEIGDPRKWSAMDIVSCVIGSLECAMAFTGPIIASVGKAVKTELELAGETATKLLTAMGKVTTALHVGESGLDKLLLVFDAAMLATGVTQMLTEEEVAVLESSLKMKTSEVDTEVRDKMASLRNSFSLASDILATGLNGGTASSYTENTHALLNFYEANSDNMNTIDININIKREERYEQLEQSKYIKEIVQKVIAGVCIGVSTVVTIASIPVTAGSSAAVAIAAIGTIATVVGGTNAIIEGASDYQNNVVVVSQCVNLGKISADNSEHIGGIAGHLEQHALLQDCLNAGAYVGDKTHAGGFVGRVASRGEVHRGLIAGKGWGYTVAMSDGDFPSYHDLYYYDTPFSEASSTNHAKALSIEQLCQSASYDNWDMNGECSIWQVANTKGYFPIPYRSEMQEEVKDEDE